MRAGPQVVGGGADLADVMTKVKAERIMLYPYAPLPGLSDPATGVEMMKALETKLGNGR
jgi:hypothetical protein